MDRSYSVRRMLGRLSKELSLLGSVKQTSVTPVFHDQ